MQGYWQSGSKSGPDLVAGEDILKLVGICGVHLIPLEQYDAVIKQFPGKGPQTMLMVTAIPVMYGLGYFVSKKFFCPSKK